MEYKEGYFNGKDGSSRFFRTWSPDSRPRATLVISHGYAEHSGRYEEFAHRMLGHNFAVWTYDHFGHGRSEGPRALIERIELLAEDLAIAIETASALHDQSPVFLYGHSMGGAIAALTTSQKDYALSGIVFSAAAVRVSDTTPTFVGKTAKLLRLFSPSLPLIPFNSEGLSHSPEILEAYIHDPLTYTGKVQVATGLEMMEAEKRLSSEALSKIRCPALVLHGKEDSVVPPRSSEFLYQSLGSKDKTLDFFDDAYHEIHNEEFCKDELYSRIAEWIEKRADGDGAEEAS